MKKFYRFLCIIITAAMMLSLCGLTVSAASKPKLNKTSASMTVGSTLNLSVSGTSAKVKWTSSDKTVCTVSSKGKVTAKSEGSARIRAKVGKYKLYCNITVSDSGFGKCNDKKAEVGGLLKFKIKYYGIDEDNIVLMITDEDIVSLVYAEADGKNITVRLKGLQDGTTVLYLYDETDPDVFAAVGITVGNGGSGMSDYSDIDFDDFDSVSTSSNDDYSGSGSASGNSSDYARDVLDIVNKERTSRGLSELVLDETLCAAADVRAQEIAVRFEHYRLDGSKALSILSEYGISYYSAGENIAQGQHNAKEVMESWMNSPGHKANILDESYTKIGIGYDAATNSWVQLFVG